MCAAPGSATLSCSGTLTVPILPPPTRTCLPHRTPAEAESPPEESDHCIEDSCFSIEDRYQSFEASTEFSISYHKSDQAMEEDLSNHMAQAQTVPECSFAADQTAPLPKIGSKRPSFSLADNRDHDKHFEEVMSEPSCASDGNGSYCKGFVTISGISLQTEPSHLPPPSRPPPLVEARGSTSNCKSTDSAGTGCDTLSFFDVEVDASSYIAMKEVRKAPEKIKCVKQLSRRSVEERRGRSSFSSVKYDYSVQVQPKTEVDQANQIEENRKKMKEKKPKELYKSEIKGREVIDHENIANWVKEALQQDANDKRFKEAVERDGKKKLKEDCQRAQNEKLSIENDNEMKLEEDREWEGKERRQRKASEREDNEKRLKETREKEENGKKLREDREEKERRQRMAFEREDNEKKLKETREKEENGKKLREDREEKERRQRMACEREDNEKKLKETREKEENEKKLREDREEKERRQRMACEREDNEKRLKETREKEESGKKLREDREEKERRQRMACEREENRLNETREEEENVKRLKEACEKEKNERRLKKERERNQNEKRLKEIRKREENERRIKESCEREENERKLKEFSEREENDERLCEARKFEENQKKVKEDCEREENVKRKKEARAREEKEKRWRGALEKEESAKKQKETKDRNDVEKKFSEACEKEEIAKRAKEFWQQKNNSKSLGNGLERGKSYTRLEAIVQKETEKAPKEAIRWEETQSLHKDPIERKDLMGLNKVYRQTEMGEKLELPNSTDKGNGFKDHGNVRGEPESSDEKSKAVEMESVVVDERNSTSGIKWRRESEQKVENLTVENVVELHLLEGSLKKVGEDGISGGQNCTNRSRKKWDANGGKIELVRPAVLEIRGNTQKPDKQERGKWRTVSTDKNLSKTFVLEVKETERIERERELDQQRLQKIEEMEREREREKDKMAVDKAILEAREKAEKAAVRRASAEAQQKALSEARERLEKACAEAREKSIPNKASMEARHTAVERATTGARECAVFEARERIERSVSDNFSGISGIGRMRQSSSSSDLHDLNSQSSSSFDGARNLNSSVCVESYDAERSEVAEDESAQRCKARLERHQRMEERAAKALEEKNMRDLLAVREQEERNRLSESLDAEVKRWSSGKHGNLRALLSTLQYILGSGSGWQPIPLTEVITNAAVKKAYRKATLCIHPDKLQQRGASIQQKYICEKVFDLLKEAWNKFNSEER